MWRLQPLLFLLRKQHLHTAPGQQGVWDQLLHQPVLCEFQSRNLRHPGNLPWRDLLPAGFHVLRFQRRIQPVLMLQRLHLLRGTRSRLLSRWEHLLPRRALLHQRFAVHWRPTLYRQRCRVQSWVLQHQFLRISAERRLDGRRSICKGQVQTGWPPAETGRNRRRIIFRENVAASAELHACHVFVNDHPRLG